MWIGSRCLINTRSTASGRRAAAVTGSWERRNETDEVRGYSGAVVRRPQLLSGLTLAVAALLTGCSIDPLRVEGRGVLTPAPFTSRQLLVKLTWIRQL